MKLFWNSSYVGIFELFGDFESQTMELFGVSVDLVRKSLKNQKYFRIWGHFQRRHFERNFRTLL